MRPLPPLEPEGPGRLRQLAVGWAGCFQLDLLVIITIFIADFS